MRRSPSTLLIGEPGCDVIKFDSAVMGPFLLFQRYLPKHRQKLFCCSNWMSPKIHIIMQIEKARRYTANPNMHVSVRPRPKSFSLLLVHLPWLCLLVRLYTSNGCRLFFWFFSTHSFSIYHNYIPFSGILFIVHSLTADCLLRFRRWRYIQVHVLSLIVHVRLQHTCSFSVNLSREFCSDFGQYSILKSTETKADR